MTNSIYGNPSILNTHTFTVSLSDITYTTKHKEE